jgi:hypothetical protein
MESAVRLWRPATIVQYSAIKVPKDGSSGTTTQNLNRIDPVYSLGMAAARLS